MQRCFQTGTIGCRRTGSRSCWRPGMLLAMLVTGVSFAMLPTAAFAQATPPKKATVVNQSLTTRDGLSLQISYYSSALGQEAAVVVLLHGRGGNRLVWQRFAETLAQNDYAVVAVDLRGHGESTGGGATASNKTVPAPKARDMQAMVAGDMEAVKKFLLEEHQAKKLNMTKLAIVGADLTTPVALAYAELDWSKEPYDDAPLLAQKTPRGQDVRALILISPELTVPGINAGQIAGRIKVLRLPTLICYGGKDTLDKGASKKITELMGAKPTSGKDGKPAEAAPVEPTDPKIYLQPYDVKLRGTDLLNKNLRIETHMLTFLNENLRKLQLDWMDRRSRLER